ncbi:MAG: molybdate ABC transporter permease subunit [Chitinophagaceae bacterium]
MSNWQPILLTFRLALVSTLILLVLAIPLAYWLAGTRSWLKPWVETVVSMPLVLPPTVLGFYFLVLFNPAFVFGKWVQQLTGLHLLFSFEGLVLASVLYSLPFMVHPVQSGFAQLPQTLKESSYVLGKSRGWTLLRILLPNIRPALLTGIVLAFAHTLGEFGVILMVGGNIPGKTKVASIAIYDLVEGLHYHQANFYAMVLLGISFFILLVVYGTQGGYFKKEARWFT